MLELVYYLNSKLKKRLFLHFLIGLGALFLLLVSPAQSVYASDDAQIAQSSFADSSNVEDSTSADSLSTEETTGDIVESEAITEEEPQTTEETTGDIVESEAITEEEPQTAEETTGEIDENQAIIEEETQATAETDENEVVTNEETQPATEDEPISVVDESSATDPEAGTETVTETVTETESSAVTLIDPYGTVYDAITKEAIANAIVKLFSVEDDIKTLYVNNPDNTNPYTSTDGTYDFDIVLEDAGAFQIEASAVGYLSYAWDFIQDDTDHHINFYLAPLQIKDSNGNMVDSGISSGWASFDNKVTIDQELLYPGLDLKIEAAEGEDPFESITVNNGITVTTRKLDDSDTDYVNDNSAGDSGSITFKAPSIHIGEGAKLLAQAINENDTIYETGDITLMATKFGGTDWMDLLLANQDNTQTEIIIADGAIIKGGAVTISATSNNTVVFDESEDDAKLLSERWLELKSVEFLEGFSLIGGVAISKAGSLISLGEGSEISADSLEALAQSHVNASTSPLGLGVGVAVGIADSKAEVILNGTINTTGNCLIKSLTDNTLQVVGSAGGQKGIGVGVAVSILNSNSQVQTTDKSQMNIGGDLTLQAETIDRNFTLARSNSEVDGKVSTAVAVSEENGTTSAFLDGRAEVTGNINVIALMRKEAVEMKKLFGSVPSIATGVVASAGTNTNSSGDLLEDTKAAITGKVKTFLKDNVKPLVSKKSSQANQQTQGQTTSFELAASVAVYNDTNKVTSRIGAGLLPNAVKSKGSITANARAESQPYLMATASVSEPADSQEPEGSGSTDEGTKFAGSAAVAIGTFTNDVTAFIAKEAAVDAAQNLIVKAEALNDYEFVYGINLIQDLSKSTEDGQTTVNPDDLVEVQEGYTAGGEAGHLYKYIGSDPLEANLSQINYTDTANWEDLGASWKYELSEFLRTFSTYLDDNLGLGNNAVNTWSQSMAKGAKVSICGAVSVIELNNNAHAYIAENAKINQMTDEAYRTEAQQVAVESMVVNEAVHFGGNIELPGITGDGKKFTVKTTLGGAGVEGENAAGGTVLVINYNNESVAEIKDGVLLYGDNLKVTADNKAFIISVAASGGEAGTFGLNGTVTVISINNTTLANIDNGARIVVCHLLIPGTETSLLVRANDSSNIINLSGGVAVSKSMGIGASVAINDITRNTQAVIGDLLENLDGVKPINPDLTIDTDSPIVLEAVNGGYIASFALAGAVSKEKSTPSSSQEAPESGGSFGLGISAEVVLNGTKDETLAYIRNASLRSTNLVISARNKTKVIAAGGSVAIVNTQGTSLGLAGAYTQNTIENKTRALIDNSDINLLTGDLTVEAESDEEIISIAASGSGSTSSNNISVAGQVSINSISNQTEASILNRSEIKAANITIKAVDSSRIFAIAGALAFGGKAGIGAAVALNKLPLSGRNAVTVSIQDSAVTASGNINLTASSTNKVFAITAAIGNSKEGMALPVSVSINTIACDTEVYIIGKKITGETSKGITAAGNIGMQALDNSSIQSIAGAGTFSKATSSLGVAVSYNNIDNSLLSYVKDTIIDSKSLAINSTMNSSIMNVSAGESANGKISANGSISINTITGKVEAYILNSIVKAETGISLATYNKSEIGAIAGAIGHAKTAAIGAALAINYIGGYGADADQYKVVSYIENSKIEVKNDNGNGIIQLIAQSEAIIKSISSAGSFSNGKAAINGAVSVNYINGDIGTYIKGCYSTDQSKLVKADGDISLEAADNAAVSVIAGNAATANKAGMGAAIAIVVIGYMAEDPFANYKINNLMDWTSEEEGSEDQDLPDSAYEYDNPAFGDSSQVRTYIADSLVQSTDGSVNLKTTTNKAIFNIAAGRAFGGKAGVKGSISINYINNNALSEIIRSTVTASGDISLQTLSLKRTNIPQAALQPESDPTDSNITIFNGNTDDANNGSHDITAIQSLAGAVAGGGKAGVGIALAVNHLVNNYITRVCDNSYVTSQTGDVILIADNQAGIKTISAGLAGSKSLAFAGAMSVNFIENKVLAYISKSTVTSNTANTIPTDGKNPGIRITAQDSSSIESLSGQLNFSGKAGIGAAAAYNEIANFIFAYIDEFSSVITPAYTTLNASSDSKIMSISLGGGFGSKLSANGSVSINTVSNYVASYILSSTVEADTGVVLTANDKSEIGSVAGAFGGSSSAAIGASVAVNYIGGYGGSGDPHRVYSYIQDSRVIAVSGTVQLLAQSDTIIKNLSAAGGFAGKAAVNGAVSLNFINTDIAAYIIDCISPADTPDGNTKQVTAQGAILIDAIDNSAISVIAGNLSGAGKAGIGAAIAIVFIGNGSIPVNQYLNNNIITDGSTSEERDLTDADYAYDEPTFTAQSKLRVFIVNSVVQSTAGAIRLTASSNKVIFNISAGVAIGGTAGVQGSVSVNYLYNDVSAYIKNSIVEAGQDVILKALSLKRTSIPLGALQVGSDWGDVSAFDGGANHEDGEENSLDTEPNSPDHLTSIQAIAGAVAGGGSAGVGVAIAVNHLENSYTTYIVGTTIKAGGDVLLTSNSQAGIETVSGAAAGSGTFAGAGSVSLNFIKNRILAFISASTVDAKDVVLEARDTSSIKSVSGQINFSGGVGLGAAAAYNEISNIVMAYVEKDSLGNKSVLNTSGDVKIGSYSTSTISTIAAAGSFAGSVAGSATVAINLINNEVKAYIVDSNVRAEGNVYVLAQSHNAINSYGGSVGGAGVAGIGAAVVVNQINNTTKAYLSQASVIALGNGAALTVNKWDDDGNKTTQLVKGLVVIADNREAITIYSGSAGVGSAGVSGQVSTNIINNITEAYLTSSNINTDETKGKWVIVRANQTTGLRIYAGSLAGGGAAVGGAVDVTKIGNQTKAYIDLSVVYAGDGVEVSALTELKPIDDSSPTVIIAGASLSGMFSLAGAVSVILSKNINEAFIRTSDIYSLGSIGVVSNHNVKVDVYAGTVSGSAFVGAGGTVIASSFQNLSRAQVKNSNLNAKGAIEVKARSRDTIDVKVGTAGVGLTGAGVAGSVSVTLIETTTEALIEEISGAEGGYSKLNQDSRYRPGGLYAPGSDQTVLIKADNQTTVDTIGGALGAGLYAGVGASLDYISILNRTVAMVGTGTKIYARGNITLEAGSEKIVNSTVYSMAGGLLGLSGAISIINIGSPISSHGAGEFNNDLRNQLTNDLSPNSLLYYRDANGNNHSRLPGDSFGTRAAQAISAAGGPDVIGSLDPLLDTSSKITAAFIQTAGSAASRAEIFSDGNVVIKADNEYNISSTPNNAVVGAAGLGAVIGIVNTRENTLAFVGNYGYIRAAALTVKAESLETAAVDASAAAGGLLAGVSANIALVNVKPLVEAYLGDYSKVYVSNDVSVYAEVTPQATADVRGVTVAGGIGAGASIADAQVSSTVNAYIGSTSEVASGFQFLPGNPTLIFSSNAVFNGGGISFINITASLVDETLSFIPRANDGYDVLRRSSGSWLDDGFVPNYLITVVEGETMSVYQVRSVSTLDLTLETQDAWDEAKVANVSVYSGKPPSEIRRTSGSWLDDGFFPDQLIEISGTLHNNGYHQIESISDDGKTLYLDVSGEVTPETIGSGGQITISGDAPDRIRRNSGSWTSDGYAAGQFIRVTGTTHNNGMYQIKSISEDGRLLTLESYSSMERESTEDALFARSFQTLPSKPTVIFSSDSVFNGSGLTFSYVTATMADTALSFRPQANGGYDVITRADGSWITEGFVAGYDITVTIGEAISTYQIRSVSDLVLTLETQGAWTEDRENVTGVSVRSSQPFGQIKRSSGNWLDEGFFPNQWIQITGTDSNNQSVQIKSISDDGKTLYLDVSAVITPETIGSGRQITISGDAPDRVRRDSGSWTDDGFTIGSLININGTAYNNGMYRIKSISEDGKFLTLETDSSFQRETTQEALFAGGKIDSTVSQPIWLGTLTVNAAQKVPAGGTTATARAHGSGGGLIAGIQANEAKATSSSQVKAGIYDNTNLTIAGIMTVNARTDSTQRALADGYNGGLGAANSNHARATSKNITEAHLNKGIDVFAYQLDLNATGLDDNYSEAVAGSGGLLTLVLIKAETSDQSRTTAYTGNKVDSQYKAEDLTIKVQNLRINSDHLARFNSKADGVSVAGIGIGSTYAYNNIRPVVEIKMGDYTSILAMDSSANASSRVEKNWLPGNAYNVRSRSGALVDVPATKSETIIVNNTTIYVGQDSELVVTGSTVNPGRFELNAFNIVVAKDKAKLQNGGGLSVAQSHSLINCTGYATVEIGERAKLISVGDITLTTRDRQEINTKTESTTYAGVSGIATGRSKSEAYANNRVVIRKDAQLYSEGNINLLAGRDGDNRTNAFYVDAKTDVLNYTVVPIGTKPSAQATTDQTNLMTIEGGALLEAVKDANLLTDRGVTIATAEGIGKNLYDKLLGTDLKEGNKSNPISVQSSVRVDGTVRVGIKNKLWLIIDVDGNPLEHGPEAWMTLEQRIPFTLRLESRETNLLNELEALNKLYALYANTSAGYAYKLQIERVVADLEKLGFGEGSSSNFKPEYPFVNYIIISNVWAQASYINVNANNLYGSGRLIAPGDAEIVIENRSTNFLRLNGLTIPQTGGDIVFNGWLVSEKSSGSNYNSYINNNNKESGSVAQFTFNIGTSSGNDPAISVENTHTGNSTAGIPAPDIEVTGEINNINGSLLLKSQGAVVCYGDINVGVNNTISSTFIQNYVDTIYNTGGEPEYLWKIPVRLTEAMRMTYTGGEGNFFYKLFGLKDKIENALNNPPTSRIQADTIYISARYLNINGTIQAGRQYNITLGADVLTQINRYRNSSTPPLNYLDAPLKVGGDFTAYWNQATNSIVIENLRVRAGYMELFGQIMNTSETGGKIEILDGYGSININNLTGYDLLLKGLDSGDKMEGKLVIYDTALMNNALGGCAQPVKVTYERINGEVKVSGGEIKDQNGNILGQMALDPAHYNPLAGQRYVWTTAQTFTLTVTSTYRNSSWLGLVKWRPGDLHSQKTNPSTPKTIRQGDYVTYDSSHINDPYLYYYQKISIPLTDENGKPVNIKVVSVEDWVKKTWWGKRTYYHRVVEQKGYKEVHTHSIKADYSIGIGFTGSESGGSINVQSNGNIIIDGAISNGGGDVSLGSSNGSIERGDGESTTISARTINLSAKQGIGNTTYILINQGGGVLNANTTNGLIDMKAQDTLTLGLIENLTGDIILTADTHILSGSASSLVKGNKIKLVAQGGRIGDVNQALRIDTQTESQQSGLQATAFGNINLKEVAGNLSLVSIESQTGNIRLEAASGDLIDGNAMGEQNGVARGQFISLWNEQNLSGSITASQLHNLLKGVLAEVLNTVIRTEEFNLKGKDIYLKASGSVGNQVPLQVNLPTDSSQLSLDDIMTIAAAEPQDLTYYDASGNALAPTNNSTVVSYVRLKQREDLNVEATGRLDIESGGSVYLGSNHNIRLGIIKGTETRIKSGEGIYGVTGGTTANITCEDLLLEAADGPIGAADAPLTITMLNAESHNITARAKEDIYLKGMAGSGQPGNLTIDFVYTPGNIYLEAAGFIRDADDIDRINIKGQSLSLSASSLGQSDNYLRINLAAEGIFEGAATNSIYLYETLGNLNLAQVSSASGDIYLKAALGIYNHDQDSTPNLEAGGQINLIAYDGDIGSLEKLLNIHTRSGGALRAVAKNDLYVSGVAGDLYLDALSSQNEHAKIDLTATHSIRNSNPIAASLNIKAKKLRLSVTDNIGALDRFLRTEVSYIEGSAQNGGIWLHNNGHLTIGDFTELQGLSSGSSMTILTSGSLEVLENITAEGEILLTALDAGSGENVQDIIIPAGITIWSKTASIELRAGDNILLSDKLLLGNGTQLTPAILKAATEVVLRVDYNNADPGVGGTLELYGKISAPSLIISGQGDQDTVIIRTSSPLPNTILQAGNGNDSITLDKLEPVISQYEGGRATITLDGQNGSDQYLINLVGTSNYIITLNDSGNGLGDRDLLTVNATDNADQILIRRNFLALINQGVDLDDDGCHDVERINYNSSLEHIYLNTLDGNDKVHSDDTSTYFTIDGGKGNDVFQIAQVFNSPRDAEAVALGDASATVHTTQGFLSRGISVPMIIYGGEGNDSFAVYHNKAELSVFGQDGDDKFLVRAFVVLDSSGDQEMTNITTGDGFNEVAYAINAPVNIDGGAGFNTLVVLLTEYNDHVVITEDKIYGAGLTVRYTSIQRIEVDGMAGDDVFYVLSTGPGVETVLIGNLGSDTFIIGGDITGQVTAIDEEGKPVILPSPTHKTGSIQGNLKIIGGVLEGADRSLSRALILPTETNKYIPTGTASSFGSNTLTDDSSKFTQEVVGYFVGVLDEQGQVAQLRRIESFTENTLTLDVDWNGNPTSGVKYVILFASPSLFVDESTQTDKLQVYNDQSDSDDSGVLTETMLSGLNMAWGIEYKEFEVLQIWLGQGNDTLTVNNTALGVHTEINGNPGSDVLNIISTQDELVLNGDEGNDEFNLDFTQADLVINGGAGDDDYNLVFNEFAEGNVTINGDAGDDYFNLAYDPGYAEYILLNGGAGSDTFDFADELVLNGKINGDADLDTLDFSDYSTARHISILAWDDSGYIGVQTGSLVGPLTSITEGFTGIMRIIGSPVAKEIEGDKFYSIMDESGEWTLDGDHSIYQVKDQAVTLNFRNYDFLYGGIKDDLFTLTGAEYGRLFAGPGHDSFRMLDGASLAGNMDGGGGNNTLDYRDYTTPVEVNLSTFTGTNITRSVVGINKVYGGQADDILIGDSGDNVLATTGGTDRLEGLYGNNTYLILAGFDTVHVLETLLGKDTLDFSNLTSDLTFEMADKRVTSGVSTVYYHEGISQGSQIEAYIGGSGNNRFVFAREFVLPQGTRIDGGAGFAILDFSTYENAGNVSLTGTGLNGYSGNQAAIPGGFANIDKLVGSLSKENTLTGMDEDSTYTFRDIHTVTVHNNSLDKDIILEFEIYQHLIGCSKKDTYAFVDGGSLIGSIDGGQGTNWLDYTNYGSSDGITGVTLDLAQGIIPGLTGILPSSTVILKAVPNIIGTPYDDNLLGDDAANIMIGGEGNDTLSGRGGDNTYIFHANADWGNDTVENSSGQGTLDFTSIMKDLTVDLGTVEDGATVTDGTNTVGFSGINLIQAGSGNNQFNISGNYAIKLMGGTGDDTFNFIGSGTLNVLIDGKAGTNTLNYSGYNTAATFNLETSAVTFINLPTSIATSLKEFSNIRHLIGSAYSDTLIGPDTDTQFNITGTDSGNVNQTHYFTEIENLQGGKGIDRFTFTEDGALQGSIDGGLSENWLDYSNFSQGNGVTVNLLEGMIQGISGTLTAVNNILGTIYDDLLIGNQADNTLSGLAGNDTLKGIGGSN
ncbi:MAG: hypothetical protein HGJ97_01595, partial [Desulfosporosinus sp.]|nr:hypothetical protein [Desulfosporosinus sp.]